MKPFKLLFALCFFSTVCPASDEMREAEFAAYIKQTLKVGKIVYLEAEGRKFLSLYAQAEKAGDNGAAIILHDLGGHPDQKPMAQALRTVLPEHRWATLALQMPIREIDADPGDYYGLFPEARSRIQAGINYLKDQGVENIVIVGYGLGGLMAAYALNETADDIKAIAAVSLPVPKTDVKAAQTLEFIKKIKMPMLDIYGELDVPEVRDSARERRLAAKDNSGYRQLEIDDEDHLYLHDDGLVVKRVYSWLSGVSGRTNPALQEPQ